MFERKERYVGDTLTLKGALRLKDGTPLALSDSLTLAIWATTTGGVVKSLTVAPDPDQVANIGLWTAGADMTGWAPGIVTMSMKVTIVGEVPGLLLEEIRRTQTFGQFPLRAAP